QPQGKKAAKVAGGAKKIRIAPCAAEPLLQQRRRGGQQEKRQADCQHQRGQEPKHGVRRWSSRADLNRQEPQCRPQSDEMNEAMPRKSQPAGTEMSIGVTREQTALKEHHAGVPDRWS